MWLVQSKHGVMRIVDDVSTMTFSSTYHCNEKKLGQKIEEILCVS